jgi:hypothetical protein
MGEIRPMKRPADSLGEEDDSASARQNPWAPVELWQHLGAAAIGECHAYLEANPDPSSDAMWTKAEEVASSIDFNIITHEPAADAGLSAAIAAAIAAALFAYMRERREHFWYRRCYRQTPGRAEQAVELSEGDC